MSDKDSRSGHSSKVRSTVISKKRKNSTDSESEAESSHSQTPEKHESSTDGEISEDEGHVDNEEVKRGESAKEKRSGSRSHREEERKDRRDWRNRERGDDSASRRRWHRDDQSYRRDRDQRGRGRDRNHRFGERERERDRDRERDRGRERDRDRERKRPRGEESEGEEEGRRRSRRNEDQDAQKHDRRKRQHSEPKEEEKENRSSQAEKKEINNDDDYLAKKRAKLDEESITTRTGGAYIPPARLAMMQAAITDKSSQQYQRIAWEALKKSINGLINKVNTSNLTSIVQELFQENLVRGRGLLARSIIQAQAASPTFTNVYAALVAIINTKFPQNGELMMKRLILNFKKGFKRNNKDLCLSSTRFLAHLVNQQVAHEIIALEILTLLLETPTNDSVEVAVGFLKECGAKLTEVSPRGINAIFERLRTILHEAQIEKRVQYMIEVMFATRKDGFKDHPAVVEELDLVEDQDQFTHMLTLEDATAAQEMLNVFKFDPEYEVNEEKYKVLKKEILDESSSDDESGSGSSSGSDSESDSSEEEQEGEGQQIVDQTETNLIALRRTIYLTIQSSLDFEECAHKLLKMELKPGQEAELCNMILDCCAQQRTFEKFFGLLAQRFCLIDKKYVAPFEQIFVEQYESIHRLETNKLRNVGKFFAHLFYSDAIGWQVLSNIKLNEDDTTSSSRIFIKILFQELSEYMGLAKLNARLKDPTLQEFFEGIFPRDNPRNTRFAINFFTSIGLGGLTDELRAHLKTKTKQMVQQQQQHAEKQDSSSSDSSESDSDSSDSDSDSSDSDSDSSSESSENEEERHRSKRKKEKEKLRKEPQKTSNRHAKKHPRSPSRSPSPQKVKEKHRKRDFAEQNGKMERMRKHRQDNRHSSPSNDRKSSKLRSVTPNDKRQRHRKSSSPVEDKRRSRRKSASLERRDLRVKELSPWGNRDQKRKYRSPSVDNYEDRRRTKQQTPPSASKRKDKSRSRGEEGEGYEREERGRRERRSPPPNKYDTWGGKNHRSASPPEEVNRFRRERGVTPVEKRHYNMSRSPTPPPKNYHKERSPSPEFDDRRNYKNNRQRSVSPQERDRHYGRGRSMTPVNDQHSFNNTRRSLSPMNRDRNYGHERSPIPDIFDQNYPSRGRSPSPVNDQRGYNTGRSVSPKRNYTTSRARSPTPVDMQRGYLRGRSPSPVRGDYGRGPSPAAVERVYNDSRGRIRSSVVENQVDLDRLPRARSVSPVNNRLLRQRSLTPVDDYNYQRQIPLRGRSRSPSPGVRHSEGRNHSYRGRSNSPGPENNYRQDQQEWDDRKLKGNDSMGYEDSWARRSSKKDRREGSWDRSRAPRSEVSSEVRPRRSKHDSEGSDPGRGRNWGNDRREEGFSRKGERVGSGRERNRDYERMRDDSRDRRRR